MTGGHIALLAIMSFVFVFTAMLSQLGGIGIGLAFSYRSASGSRRSRSSSCWCRPTCLHYSAVFIGMAIHAHH
jgi:hypothetical protein